MLARTNIVADIHQRNRIIIMLFRSFKLGSATLHLLIARIQMDGGPVGKFSVRARHHLLQQRLRFVVFVLLHCAQPAFVGLQKLSQLRIAHERVLGCRFLRHLKDFS